jgi:hypothetical protein
MNNTAKIKIGSARTTNIVELPSYKGAEVEIYTTLLVGQLEGLDMKSLDNNPTGEDMIKILARIIKSWNLTDDNEADLEINEDNVRLLPAPDMIAIFQSLQQGGEKAKKK